MPKNAVLKNICDHLNAVPPQEGCKYFNKIKEINNFLINVSEENCQHLSTFTVNNISYNILFKEFGHLFAGRSFASVIVQEINSKESFIQPFYQSTGYNSGMPGSWLPFNGMWHNSLNNFVGKSLMVDGQYYFFTGWLRKSCVDNYGESEFFSSARIPTSLCLKISQELSIYFNHKIINKNVEN